MLDCSPKKIHEYRERYGVDFWQLRTPLTQYALAGVPYGLDNGCFKRFNEKAWSRLLNEAEVNMPKFVIIDECHSSMSNETYNLLLYLKNNCKSKIHGFSATPSRTGKSYTNININIDTDVDINTNKNKQKLLNIFHEQEDKSKLNK